MTIHPFGNQAILVNFSTQIDPAINQQVIQLYQALKNAPIIGITNYIPAYCSLTVGFDPQQITFLQLSKTIRQLAENPPPLEATASAPKLIIPVCYEPPFALDMDEVLHQTQLSQSTLIQLHCQTLFQVYMLGFLPGFAYLGKVPTALSCLRKPRPRLKVPAGAVGLAGQQTGIYPSSSPGGWQIIGQTPLPIFAPNAKQPFLLQVGDKVQFKAIDKHHFQQIKDDISKEEFNWKDIYG